MFKKAFSGPRPLPVEEAREKMFPAAVGIEIVSEDFINPVALAAPPDSSGRLFVVDQAGKVLVLRSDGTREETPFLDIADEIVELAPKYDERGLLGMAFHPQFRTNGKFYLFYSAPLRDGAPKGWNCTNHLVEYRAAKDDPNRADPGSRRVLLSLDKPQMNHNGGHIAFGPDGYLYVPLGDGGGENDKDEGHTPGTGNGQDLNALLGKILRIDVDGRSDGKEYGIPPGNPFTDGQGPPEIFAYGLRNPYHISFDAGGDRQLFAGDAGQVRWEEIDIIVRGGNYGWNLKEGSHCFDPNDNAADRLGCSSTGFRGEPLIDPIIEYRNLSNRSGGIGSVVIGGYVYRGRAMSSLRGRYIFGDLSGTHGRADGRMFVGSPPPDGGAWVMDEIIIEGRDRLNEYVLAFGQDIDNELYVLTSDTQGPSGSSGRVYKIVPPRKS
ncbi:PQQ-dependent sugar dehydrogenase [Methanomassiliicoccus luminyensis]|uniref:PQQ-dependent sugar dehydrogenase n=1 Tax=Methanomassiliicoccus luminyensis TaxID=1080712 RepID=UPI00037D37A2|nr:PQQ-dependent sugar dehydrogenase [Methanomassiliicoccus luminyensis]